MWPPADHDHAARRHACARGVDARVVGASIGGGVAPWFGGVVHDFTGSYHAAFLVAVGFCAVASACFWLARPPRRVA
jgi:cyanate permease